MTSIRPKLQPQRAKPARQGEFTKQIFDFGIRVGRGWRPTVEDLRDHLGCSRATAYRYHALVRRAEAADADQQSGVLVA
jgi:hypothetical protein